MRWGISLAATALLASFALPAAAYCRTTTCDPNVDCEYNEMGCPKNGDFLHWANSCVSFGVQENGSRRLGIDYETMHRTVNNAFGRWLSVECEGGGKPGFYVADMGAIVCNQREYNKTRPNANVWMFRDTDWPYEGPYATLALTTLTYQPDSGEIYDVDVEINSFKNNITIGDNSVDFDLESIVTHEAGHFLGLSHTEVEGGTMVAGYEAGTVDLRSLAHDDIAGMCEIYPPDPDLARSSCEPRHGFSRQCAAAQDEGCSIASTRGSAKKPPALALLAGLVAAAWSLRRRRARAAGNA
jgi:MYXO-CTERM domain-containing protein